MVPNGYIPDGYISHAYLAPRPKRHGAVRFAFSPILICERSAFLEETESAKLKAAAKERKTAAKLAEKMQSWDLKDHTGAAVDPKKPESYLKLDPSLHNAIVSAVFGYGAWDDDPDQVDAPEAPPEE